MALSAGTNLGPYEILGPIGAGGMGEVYKASDTRLNRTVAIKVMPPHFADDPAMKQRFDREAQTIAGLSHPHICTLHDVGEAPGAGPDSSKIQFLVMEYLEGVTLADRLAGKRGRASSAAALGEAGSRAPASSGISAALGIDEILRIAIAIADALDKAHRQGVVHRDLKPANVMLSKSGVKLLDFGLAKWTAAGQRDSLAAMPTRADLSTPGMVLGTLQYMAPEQVEGKEADARTDIFAFGALLYEMVTGNKAFQGRSQATLISAIMTGEPPRVSEVQPLAPTTLDHVIDRCLAKDPEDRWQDAHSLLIELQWIVRGRTNAQVPASVAAEHRRRDRLARMALIAAAVVVAALAVPAVRYVRGPEPPSAFAMRVPVLGLSQSNVSLSPNGREIALVAQPDSQQPASLYVRALHAPTFRRLTGTADVAQPFWSPDSRAVAFVSGGKLKRVDAAGGAPKDIAVVPEVSGGAWNAAGTIVFGSSRGLFRVPAEGGTPELLTTTDKTESGHFWPSFLPDGRHYLFLAWSSDPSGRAVYVADIGSQHKVRLMATESNVAYAPSTGSGPGYLVYHREASLFAHPFDATTRTFAGDPVQVAGGIAFSQGDGRGVFDVSRNGVLLFFQGATAATGRGQTQTMQFGWVNRTGRRLENAVDAGPHGDLDLSPDQRSIALTKHELGSAGADIWVIDWAKGIQSRLTLDPGDDINPVWSHDGTRIAFTSYRKGNADIFMKNANGTGEDVPLVQTSSDELVEAWSRDGRYLAYLVRRDKYQDIYVLPLAAGGKPFPVVQGPFRKDEPQFSYDGKWLAYTSDESSPGQFEVYVISFPAGDQKRKVSIGGGGQPRWRQDSRELFYRTVREYMAVDFMPGPRIDSGVPQPMFSAPTPGGGNITSSDPVRHQWAAAPDGQRFLVRVPPVGSNPQRGGSPAAVNIFTPSGSTAAGIPGRGRGLGAPTLTVIMHWPASLRKAGQ